MIYKVIYKVQKLRDAHELQEKISRAGQEDAGRKELRIIHTDPPCFHCTKKIHGRSTMLQALKSGHAGLGLPESNPTST